MWEPDSCNKASRDYCFNPDLTPSRRSHLRLKDNYLRFYLKYIEPNKIKIQKGGKRIQSLSEFKNFEGILGLQFKNLILANRESVIKFLKIENSQIETAAPYFQDKTKKNKLGCQIDLLIHTKLDVFYLCEMKCKRTIDNSVVEEVKKKCKALKLPKRSSLKPVLIYIGEIYQKHRDEIEEYFFQIISFEDLLKISLE